MTDAGADEVVQICQELIRIDTTNTGDTATSAGERAAAEYVAAKLSEVGLEPVMHESEPGRTSVVARMPGADPSRDALLIHGHLDVVPADALEWSVDPFSGEERDGYIWGRGAVDMKDFDAMTLALVRQWRREGRVPPRDIVLAFLADEEAGGRLGAHHLVDHRPELFEGVTEAIGEVGGFSVTVSDDLRLYLIETAQKGISWIRLTATGRPGHGSMVHDDNAVTRLCEAVATLGRYRFPIELTDTVRGFLEQVCEALGIELDVNDPELAVAKLGPIARVVGATLPSNEGRFLHQIKELIGPDVQAEFIEHQPALETSFDGALVDAMADALRELDPAARPVPYMLSGGTDAKAFARLGIRCFGFAPLKLPAGLDFSALFHGIDERVPVDGLKFGVGVLDRFLSRC